KLLLVVCALALARVEAAAAAACSCAESLTVSKAKDRAEAVFVGTVVEANRERTQGGYEWRVKLSVEQAWKGSDEGEVVVYVLGDDCAVSFEAGKRYLVYARRQEGRGRLVTDSCARTALFDAGSEDLQKLGAGKQRAAR
ncbi:MAG TPA: hypothetical protein VE713_18040, partial [Pyrinomonadaceae bacterium]|nr:hypothetical protein [Pyrinomonadaceae bacterium]